MGGGGEPEEEGADEKHDRDAVHGASQRLRPRRLPPPRRRQRVIRRQRRLAPAHAAAAVRHARPARRSPHPRGRLDETDGGLGEERERERDAAGRGLRGCLDGWGRRRRGGLGLIRGGAQEETCGGGWVGGRTPPSPRTVRYARQRVGVGGGRPKRERARFDDARRGGASGAASAFRQARSFPLARL